MADYGVGSDARELITSGGDLRVLLASLTSNQLQYLAVRVNTHTDREACELIGLDGLASSRWPNKGDVDLALKGLLMDRALIASERLARLVDPAVLEIEDQLRNGSKAARRWAAEQVLDRSIGKAVARVDARVNDREAFRSYDDLLLQVYGAGSRDNPKLIINSGALPAGAEVLDLQGDSAEYDVEDADNSEDRILEGGSGSLE